jgi:protoheme ferro-lyase
VAPNGTSDWFLPSRDEMTTLVTNASASSVTLIPSSAYWTSSQSTTAANQVLNVNSSTGVVNDWYKNQSYILAPVRAG